MKRILNVAIFIMAFAATTQGQVTIGSGNKPNENALLDLNGGLGNNTSDKGLLLPRVALTDASLPAPMTSHVAGMVIYNTNTVAVPDPMDNVSAGFYYNTGTRWEKLQIGKARWFYMPSIPLDVSRSDTIYHYDLYAEYVRQFHDRSHPSHHDGKTDNTPLIKSLSIAPDLFKEFPARGELYYYVTGYDSDVFTSVKISPNGGVAFNSNPISVEGILQYTVDASKVTDATFMNIIFVEKN
ncbi:hypothetical protein FACS189426_24360 [Bacteroidia bacterium]|nr:hypothetical protein FACS189426_24360 [Bacteroidia bacterium]